MTQEASDELKQMRVAHGKEVSDRAALHLLDTASEAFPALKKKKEKLPGEVTHSRAVFS